MKELYESRVDEAGSLFRIDLRKFAGTLPIVDNPNQHRIHPALVRLGHRKQFVHVVSAGTLAIRPGQIATEDDARAPVTTHLPRVLRSPDAAPGCRSDGRATRLPQRWPRDSTRLVWRVAATKISWNKNSGRWKSSDIEIRLEILGARRSYKKFHGVVTKTAIVAGALLADCRTLRILVTSREPLRMAGERTYRAIAPWAIRSASPVRRISRIRRSCLWDESKRPKRSYNKP
jgi:hypothetical protein